jgi:multicomponent Na+:H+ antiporter subunit G
LILEYILYILLAIGVFFNLLGSIGLIRFPDVYTRLHAGTKCTTFGSIFICGAIIIYGLHGWFKGDVNGSVLAFHVAIALIAILLTNPTGAHAIARAAHRSGVMPFGAVVDDLKDGGKARAKAKRKPTQKKTGRSKKEAKK